MPNVYCIGGTLQAVAGFQESNFFKKKFFLNGVEMHLESDFSLSEFKLIPTHDIISKLENEIYECQICLLVGALSPVNHKELYHGLGRLS